MAGYFLRRLLAALPTLFGITLLSFLIIVALPGDPALSGLEPGAPLSAEAQARLEAARPPQASLPVRYADWLLGVARFDLGRSSRDGRPVGELLRETLPFTLLLNLSALALIYGAAIPSGFAAARRPRSRPIRILEAGLLVIAAIPPFASALLLQRWLSVRLGLLPLQGAGGPLHLLLPAICLAAAGTAYATRQAAAAFGTLVLSGETRAARARGLRGWALARHVLPNALLPFVWLLGGLVPGLLAGSVLVEEAFSWPGAGRLLVRAVTGRDQPVILALLLVSAIAVLLAQVLADLLYPILDPRLRDSDRSDDGAFA
jgi:peptide/nickel transport system permease protein